MPWQGTHNNRAERAIRPFVIGRKNWLCVSRRRRHDDDMKTAA
nr:IS66 family transposase [Azotobacter salinestris]